MVCRKVEGSIRGSKKSGVLREGVVRIGFKVRR